MKSIIIMKYIVLLLAITFCYSAPTCPEISFNKVDIIKIEADATHKSVYPTDFQTLVELDKDKKPKQNLAVENAQKQNFAARNLFYIQT